MGVVINIDEQATATSIAAQLADADGQATIAAGALLDIVEAVPADHEHRQANALWYEKIGGLRRWPDHDRPVHLPVPFLRDVLAAALPAEQPIDPPPTTPAETPLVIDEEQPADDPTDEDEPPL